MNYQDEAMSLVREYKFYLVATYLNNNHLKIIISHPTHCIPSGCDEVCLIGHNTWLMAYWHVRREGPKLEPCQDLLCLHHHCGEPWWTQE